MPLTTTPGMTTRMTIDDVVLHDDEAVPVDDVPEESDEVGTAEGATTGVMHPIEMETNDEPGSENASTSESS